MTAPAYADPTLARDSMRFVLVPIRAEVASLLARTTRSIPLTMLRDSSSDFDLIIRQQPDRALVASGKKGGGLSPAIGRTWARTLTCADRKPIDPPPIVQLRARDPTSYLAQ